MLGIFDILVAISLIFPVDLPGITHSTSSDKFEWSLILWLGKRKNLFFIRFSSTKIENDNDRILTNIFKLKIISRSVYRRIKSWNRDSGAINLCVEKISIIGRMCAIFQNLESEISEWSLIKSSRYTAESSTINQFWTSTECCISRHIHNIAMIWMIMDFTSKVECLARQDQSDISDILKCCHDIVSSIITINICSRFPRDQLISKISDILLVFE